MFYNMVIYFKGRFSFRIETSYLPKCFQLACYLLNDRIVRLYYGLQLQEVGNSEAQNCQPAQKFN